MVGDYTVIILRPFDRGPRPGWKETTCPGCGRPAWDSDPDGTHEAKLRKYGDVYKHCGPCDLQWVLGERGILSKLEIEEDAV